VSRVAIPVRHSPARSPLPRLALRAIPGLQIVLLASPAVFALVVWRISLSHVDTSHLDSYGLPTKLPLAWYGALLVNLLGASLALTARRMRGWVFAVYLVAIAVMLYGSVPVISAQPHYSWVYKHLGVTRLLETGKLDLSADIYNRWPGFFALAAAFSRVSGYTNPELYAAWAELFFTLVDALLVAVAVRALTRDARVAAGAVLLTTVGDWIGQSYYAPQAFAFTLSLVLMTVVAGQLRKPVGRATDWLIGATERVTGIKQQSDELSPPTWSEPVTIAIVLLLDAVIIGSHQLTPYVLLVQMALLAVAGLLARRWFVLVMAAMTFAYLAPNLSYIEHHFGLFTSIDPFNNLKNESPYGEAQEAGRALSAHAGQLLSLAIWFGAVIAGLVLLRRGLLRRAFPLVLLAAAPFAVIFGQNYGGEASLRLVLFSLPWCAALISWALKSARSHLVYRVLTAVTATGMAALFIPAFMGGEELNLMPAGEVQASEWFYAHAPAGAVLMQAAPDFPARVGPRYRFFAGPKTDDDPNLLRTKLFRHRPLGPQDVGDAISIIHQYSKRGYLVFSTTETRFAHVFRLTAPGALAQLEDAVARSSHFRLYYRNKDARIYELLSPRGVPRRARRMASARFRARVQSRLLYQYLPVGQHRHAIFP
jgi:hypothetical protein